MIKLGFICHPLDFHHLANVDQGILNKSPKLVRQMMAQLPPSHVRTYEFESSQGQRVQCEMICVWLLPDQFKSLHPKIVKSKMDQAFRIAEQLQCQMVGLGAYTKIAELSFPDLYDRYPFAVTTGNIYTAALSAKTLEQLIASRHLNRHNLELTVIGATGAIGNAVCRVLAPQVAILNLVARNERRLNSLAKILQNYGPKIRLFSDAKLASQEADLVFLATSEPGLLIQARDLSLNTCVVDVSKPVNVVADPLRQDITIVDCALIATPPRRLVQNWVQCFPQVEGLDSPEIFACFAEALILALEGKIEDFSRGRFLNIRKFPEIRNLAKKHGFGSKLEIGPWSIKSSVELSNWLKKTGIA